MTYYDVLGVAPTAGADELRRTYVALARRHHPDLHGQADTATQRYHRVRMAEVAEAFQVLSDPSRRLRYDHSLGGGSTGPYPSGPAQRSGGAGQADTDTDTGIGQTDDVDDTAEEHFGDVAFSDLTVRRSLAVAPAFLLAAAGVVFLASLIFRSTGLLIVAYAGIVAGAVSFLLMPLMVIARARRRQSGVSLLARSGVRLRRRSR